MKFYLYIFILSIAMLTVACNRGSNPQQSNHTKEKHDHNHDDHDGHDHDHDDHDHDHDDHDHDGHNHDHDDHDHGPSVKTSGTEEHPDEIVFTKAQAEATGLQLTTVKPGQFHMVVKTGGQIQAAQGDEVTLVAAVSGIVSFLKTMTEGMAVSQGENLLAISSKNLSEGDPLVKTRLAYEVAEREYKRAQSLVKDTLISQREFEQTRLTYETAQVAYQALSGTYTAKGIGLASSINGFVKTRLVNEGEYVSTGQALVTLARNKRLQLKADVPEKYYKNLPKMHSANFKTLYDNTLYQLTELNGKMISYGRSSGDAFYIPVTFEFDNVGAMIPGSFVEVYLLSDSEEQVLALPLSALIEEQGVYSVYLSLGSEVYKKQQITKGDDNGTDVHILSGLKEGDQVVTKGAIQIKLASSASGIPEHSHSH